MKISKQTTIQTERCYLRIIKQEDIPFTFSATRYQGFNDGMPWEPPEEEKEMEDHFCRGISLWEKGHAFNFTICNKENDLPIGRISIRKSKGDNLWDMGYWIHPEYQGNGYMTESVRALIDFGFIRLKAKRIEACYATWNKASERVLEKIGMKFIEYLPEGFKKRGE